MFHHVGLSWMIETKEKYAFAVEEHFIEQCKVGPFFNKKNCQNLHSPIFEELFVTTRQDRYELMCGLYAFDKNNDKSTDATKFGGIIPLT